MSLAQQEFTNAGKTMLGRAQNGETLTISSIVVGNGTANQPSDLWPLTQLISQKLSVTIAAKNDDGQGTLLVEGSFLSSAAPSAFYLREVGVLAHIGSEADQLYSVSNVYADPPDYIDPAAPTIEAFKIKLVITRIPTGNVIVQIGPTDAIMGQNVGPETVGPGVFKDAVGNLLEFKRLVQGQNILLTEDATNHNWIRIDATITSFQLTQNLDLYVPMSYPAPDGTPPSAFFPSIQAAHDYLLQFHIPSNYFATIHVWKGSPVLNINTPTVFSHPDSKQIIVLGQDPTSLVVSGSFTVTGTLPNISVVVPIANTAGISVGDVVYLLNAPHVSLEGAGYVTSIIANRSVTIAMRIDNTMPPASILAIATTRLIWFPTQIQTNVPSGQIVLTFNNGLNLFKNFALKSGGNNTNGIMALDNSVLQNVVVIGYQQYGIVPGTGSMTLNPIVASNACGVGLAIQPYASAHAGPPNSVADRTTWGGSLTYGIWCNGGSFYSANGSFTYIMSNSLSGVRCDNGYLLSGITGSNAGGLIVGANDFGLDASVTGVILTANQSQNSVTGNSVNDCRAAQGGQISIIHNVNTSGSYNPANKVLGPDGAYISISSP